MIGSMISLGIARTAFTLGEQNGKDGLRFTFRVLSGSTTISYPVEFMRNRLVGMALTDPTVTDLWFLDSDVMPPDNVLQLLMTQEKTDADIVAGIYRIPDDKVPEGVWSVYRSFLNSPVWITIDDDHLPKEPFPADGAGTGAMIIRRRVLDDARLRLVPDSEFVPQMDSDKTGRPLPCIFRTQRSAWGELITTDDLDFCYRTRALGYSLIVDPRVRFGHIKQRVL